MSIDLTARDPFAATNAARLDAERIAAHGEKIDEYRELTVTMPDDTHELPAELTALLNPDERDLWALVDNSRREVVLQRAWKRCLAAAERRVNETRRQDSVAHYIDRLCVLIDNPRAKVGDQAYEQLQAEFAAAKTNWESMARNPRTRVHARRIAVEDQTVAPATQVDVATNEQADDLLTTAV